MPLTDLTGGQPFVLLDDARHSGAVPARLLTDPVDIIRADDGAGLPALLATLRDWQAHGHDVGGYFAYEAGAALEPRLAALATVPADGQPLAWFARFATARRIAPADVAALLPDPAGAAIGTLRPCIDRADYAARFAAVRDHILAGDIYQANLTFAAEVAVAGAPLALYARIRRSASAGYGGVVFDGDHWLLSFSPELFFSLKGGHILARPMKGTAERQADPAMDAAACTALAADPKQRAENLMIVDLLRNDLSKIALPGSVSVPSLFRVETYPTIHQMVSDVAACLPATTSAADVITQIFPCGSITGAPKIRAMDIIAGVEARARGAYTGSIGWIGGAGEAAFNVAIRTLLLRDGEGCATLGLGSGVVADSDAQGEWRECLAKGEFLRNCASSFDLIETMAFDPLDGIRYLDRHIERLCASALALDFRFDRHALRNMLQYATIRRSDPARLRVRISRPGHIAIVAEPMPAPPPAIAPVALAPLPVDPADFRLRHKTSDRAFYDDARTASGAFEVAFVDPAGHITEGSFTNIFVPADGILLTPPLALGLLPGVLRAQLIDDGLAREAPLTAADLAGGFQIGNALRGLMPAALA